MQKCNKRNGPSEAHELNKKVIDKCFRYFIIVIAIVLGLLSVYLIVLFLIRSPSNMSTSWPAELKQMLKHLEKLPSVGVFNWVLDCQTLSSNYGLTCIKIGSEDTYKMRYVVSSTSDYLFRLLLWKIPHCKKEKNGSMYL